LGEFTFAALLHNTLENLVLLCQMQRICGYYRGLVPEAGEDFDPPEAGVLYQAAVATIGCGRRQGSDATSWSKALPARSRRPGSTGSRVAA
jgi:hypothetical protein